MDNNARLSILLYIKHEANVAPNVKPMMWYGNDTIDKEPNKVIPL